MPQLTRHAMQTGPAGKPAQLKRVDTGEWGKDTFVYVGRIRARDFSMCRRIATMAKGLGEDSLEVGMMVALCIVGCVNNKGDRVFQESDFKTLLNGPIGPIQRIASYVEGVSDLVDGGGSEPRRKKRTQKKRKSVTSRSA